MKTKAATGWTGGKAGGAGKAGASGSPSPGRSTWPPEGRATEEVEPAVHRAHGPVRFGQVAGHPRARRSRLLLRRQPADDADSDAGGAVAAGQPRHREGRHRRGRPRREFPVVVPQDLPRAAEDAAAEPGADLPRGQRHGARAAVQRDATAPSAGPGSLGERRDSRRAGAAECHPRHGRRDRRHVRHDRARAAAVLHGAVAWPLAHRPRHHASELRLQVWSARRRRSDVRRAMPAESAFRADAAPAHRPRSRGREIHGEGRADARVHGQARGVRPLRRAALHRGRKELSHHRHRLHRRPPSFRDDRGTAAARLADIRGARVRVRHRDIGL